MRRSAFQWWRHGGLALALCCLAFPGVRAQVRCTMPSGVVITQQLGVCPRDAVAAARLDGTPVPLSDVLPQRAPASKPQTAPVVVPLPPSPVAHESSSGGGLSFWESFAVMALAFGLVMAVKGSAGVSGAVMYCTSCGTQARGKTSTRGSLLIEVVLWLCFLIPGLIYSVWRQGSKHKVCQACGAASLVPLTSPVARAARAGASPLPQSASGADASRADVDAWEGSFFDVAAQRSAKKTVRIVYRDGNGSESERVVDIRAFEPSGASGMVIGRCHLRNATRTFRFDRMERVVDEETGEIIPDLQALLNAEWEASPEPVLDALFAEHRDLLRMLLYAAKADGVMRSPEVQVIARHCAELTGDDRMTPALVRDLLSVLDLPTSTSFVRAYNRLRRERPGDAERAAQACREIVATQKAIHPAEQAMLDVLNKPLPRSSGGNASGGVAGA